MSFEQIDTLQPLLARIDGTQREINMLKARQPDAYARLMESWAVESTYNSNTIEGSALSLGDTALLYDGAVVDAPLTDIRQAEGGFAALRFLDQAIGSHDTLSEELIRHARRAVDAAGGERARLVGLACLEGALYALIALSMLHAVLRGGVPLGIDGDGFAGLLIAVTFSVIACDLIERRRHDPGSQWVV